MTDNFSDLSDEIIENDVFFQENDDFEVEDNNSSEGEEEPDQDRNKELINRIPKGNKPNNKYRNNENYQNSASKGEQLNNKGIIIKRDGSKKKIKKDKWQNNEIINGPNVFESSKDASFIEMFNNLYKDKAFLNL